MGIIRNLFLIDPETLGQFPSTGTGITDLSLEENLGLLGVSNFNSLEVD
jgi:hypothetical protein